MKTQTETVGKYTLFVRRWPFTSSRKTVVLVHGIGVSGLYFIPLAERLSRSLNVIALDLPGYGKANKPDKPLTINELSLVLEQYLIQSNMTSYTLIGQSMGCQISTRLAQRRPEFVMHLILLAPTVNQSERTVKMQAFRLLQDMMHETLKANAVIVTDYFRMGMFRYAKTSKWMVGDAIEDNLENISTPTLIVGGGKDKIVPPEWLMYLAKLSGNIQLREIPTAAHALHFTYAREVADICSDFLNDS